MGWKGKVFDVGLAAAKLFARNSQQPPPVPESIFVLRNNDLGDVLVITPLFEALKRRFPQTRLCAGVGSWSRDLLIGNPYIDEVLTVNAPWHNHAMPDLSLAAAARYIAGSSDIKTLRAQQFSIGIDVLGSGWGMALLMRLGIPYRLGVRGYAGGHTGAQATVPYDPYEHVARMALRFAECLGATVLPSARPQIFLLPQELFEAEERWKAIAMRQRATAPRVLIAPGAGRLEKMWPVESYAELLQRLSARHAMQIVFTGAQADVSLINRMRRGLHHAQSCAGELSLRQSIAMAARADWVITSPSMMMHATAAFRHPMITLLGPSFPSAQDHSRQWGYDGPCWVFGREYAHPLLPTAGNVFEAIDQLWQIPFVARQNEH